MHVVMNCKPATVKADQMPTPKCELQELVKISLNETSLLATSWDNAH